MAEEKIVIGIEVQGAEKSINSVKDLKDALKEAKNEQVRTAMAFGEGSKEYIAASRNVAGLKDKFDDLNDSTKTLKGSGVEGLTSSFGLLKQGIGNFDFGAIKAGFKGIGTAMSAIPLILLIQGITFLAEKFNIFGLIAEGVTFIIDAFTDALGFTNKAAEKQSKELIENLGKEKTKLTERYDAELKLKTAAGESTKALELEKLRAVENNIAEQVKLLDDLQKTKGKLNDEELKNYETLQSDLLKATTDRQVAETKQLQEQKKTFADIESKLAFAKLNDKQKENFTLKEKQTKENEELAKNMKLQYGNELQGIIAFNKAKTELEELHNIEAKELNKKQNTATAKQKVDYSKELAEQLKNLEIENINNSQDRENAVLQNNYEKQKKELISKGANHEILYNLEKKFNFDKNQITNKYIALDVAAEEKKAADIKVIKDKQAADEKIAKDKALEESQQAYEDELATLDYNNEKKLSNFKGTEIEKNAILLQQLNERNILETEMYDAASKDKTEIDRKYFKDLAALQKKTAADELKAKKDATKQGFDIAKEGGEALSALSNLAYNIKLKNVKKGSDEEKKILKEQFETNKKFQIANAIINGITAVGAILAVPDFSFGVLSAIRIAAAAITTAANVAAIEGTTFDGGGSVPNPEPPPSGGGGTDTNTKAPSIYTPQSGQSTTFSGNNNNTPPIKAVVIETENRSATMRINKLVNESSY